MIHAILLKEWIKWKRFGLLALFLNLCFTFYALLRLNRVINFRGVTHLWEILLIKEVVFIDILQYLPLLTAVLAGIIQFVPEMQQKRLKLTLHLPFPQGRMITTMTGFGLAGISIIFILQYILLSVYLYPILAAELVNRILLTALPWFLAGITAYLFTVWICIEPTWKRRIVDMLIATGTLRIFFLSDSPQAYDSMLFTLILFIFCIFYFPWLSVKRFITGKQD